MNKKDYLPIGTVVLLRNGEQRLMITGFKIQDKENGKIYDYTGCLYPEGYMMSDMLMLFDHSDISKIYHMGYSDEEDKEFRNKLITM